jgi:hypothetical protein
MYWQKGIQTVPPPCPATGYMTKLLTLIGLGTFKIVVRAHETLSHMKPGQRLEFIKCVFTTSEFRRNPKVSICFTVSDHI